MNKIYKVIWSKARNCYVVVSELAKRNGKCKAAKTDNVNEGNLLNGMSGATSLHKAAVALLLAGMIGIPGVGEAGIGIGVEGDRNNNKANIDPATNNTVTVDSGFNSIGIGYYANAGQNAVAIGGSQTSNGTPTNNTQAAKHAVAVGYASQATGENALTLGSYTVADKFAAIAVGRSAESHAAYAMAQGYTANAQGEYSIALGYKAATTDTGDYSIAQGYEATASGAHSVALGSQLTTSGDYAIGIGYVARARVTGAVAIGNEAGSVVYSASGNNDDVASDYNNGANSIAIGNGAKNFTFGFNQAKSYQTYANTYNSISIGAKTHTHAAYAAAIGSNSDASGARSLAFGTSDTSYQPDPTATDYTPNAVPHTGARAAGQGSIVIGDQAKALSDSIEFSYMYQVGDNTSEYDYEKDGKKYKFVKEDGTHAYDRATDFRANDAIAVGTKTEARANNGIAIGGNLSYTFEKARTATKDDSTTTYYKTVYGKGADGRTSGAIVGDGADAAIAIGGASGTIDRTNNTITVTTNPAAAFGTRSIAIGSGALVETNANHSLLNMLLNSQAYQDAITNYTTARNNYTSALMNYNNTRNALLQLGAEPIAPSQPTVNEADDPDAWAEYYDKLSDYNTSKALYDAAQDAYNTAKAKLFGDGGAAANLSAAAADYETQMNLKRQYEDADSNGTGTSIDEGIAIGAKAEARAKQSTVLGPEAIANDGAIESVVIGEDARAGEGSTSAVVIGNDANTGTYSTQSIAIGYHAMTKSNNSVADAIAIGSNTGVFSTTGIAIGSMSQVAGIYSGAIGSEVPSLTDDPTQKDHNSVAGDYSYAIGNGNTIGKQSFEEIARKEGVDTTETDSDGNKVNIVKAVERDNSTSRTYVLGARNKVGTKGKTNYVYTIGYLNTIEEANNAAVIGENNKVTGTGSKVFLVAGKGHYFENLQNSLIIGGHENEVTTPVKNLSGMLVYGFNAKITDNTKSSILIGQGITMQADDSIAIGTGANVTTEAKESIAIGKGAKAQGTNSISIGTGNVVTGEKSGAIGDPSTINGANSYSVGNNNTIAEGKANVFALGNNITSVESDSVFLGSNSAYVATTTADTATTKGTDKTYTSATINGITYDFAGGSNVAGVVSVGDVGKERRIQNVAPGLISAASTDAVNGSQLYAVINSGWKVGDNNSTAQATIASTRQVNYINGNGTTSKVTQVKDPADANKVIGANVQYDVNRSTITVGTNGTVTADTPDTSTTSYFATATTVQNAINNSGWNVTSSANGGTASNSTTKLVNPGSTVEYVAGSGIKITQEQDGTKTKFTFEADASSGGSGSGSNITDESNKIIKQVTTDKRSTNAYTNSDGLWTVTTPYIDIHGTADEAGEAKDHWSRAMAQRAVAIGHDSKVDEIANDGLAAGTGNMVASQKGLAIGAKNTVGLNADESMAIGSNNTVSGQQSQAIGSGNTVTGAQSIAIGTGHRVTGSRSGAIGDPNIVNASNSYAVGNNSNIAAGQTDVFAFGNDIKKTTSNSVFLGSNTAYVPEGATTAGMSDYSSATISGKTYNFAGGKPAGVVSVGDVGKERRIQNVAAGKVSPESTDAVNGSQLYHAMNDTAQAVTQDVTGMMHQQEGRLRKGIAGAAALAALHPLEFDPDDKLTFAAGVGNFRGETAAAIGAFYRPDEKVMFSIGGTFGNSENLVNAGISFSLDRTPRKTSSRTAMAKEIVELREQVAQLTALVHQIAGNQGLSLPMPPAMFPNTPENKWAYDYIESLQKQGVLSGYAGRELTRNEMAAALDRALASGAKLDERITREFAPELSRIRVVFVNGQVDGEARTFERPRSSVHEYK